MDGYQSDCEFLKFVPALKVIPPTSQLANARQTIPLRLPKRQLTTRKPQPGTTETANAELAIQLDAAPETDQDSNSIGLLSGLPSWLVSLAAHLCILLILAICSFGGGDTGHQFVIEISDTPTELETLSLDVTMDEVEIEDTFESLEPLETDALENELPTLVPIDMMREVAEFDLAKLHKGGFDALNRRTNNWASGARRSGTGKNAEFFGTVSLGYRFVFVIDCSSSMSGHRWHRAVKELDAAIDALEKNQEFLVLLYNTHTRVMMDKKQADAALIKATESNKHYFQNWLHKQGTNGGTFPAQSMYLALTFEPDAIYFLSDGELKDQTVRLLRIWNVAKPRADGSSSKTPIHTISLGVGRGSGTMKDIANENSGTFSRFR